MRKVILSSIFYLFLILSNGYSQDLIYPEIEKELSPKQKVQFNRAIRILMKATGNENNANAIDRKYSKLQRKNKKKVWEEKTWEAKEQRILAERNLETAYKKIFAIYSDLITNSKYKSDEDELKAMSLNEQAKSKFEDARELLSKYKDLTKESLLTIEYEQIKNTLSEAYNLKVEGIRNQITALQINRGKAGIRKEEELAWGKANETNSITSYHRYLNENPRGKHMAEANEKIRELEKKSSNDLIASNEKRNPRHINNKENNETNTKNTENINNNQNNKIKSNKEEQGIVYKDGELTFRVQFAAATFELSDWYINAKVPGVKNYDIIQSKGWMKYMVGNFKTYHKAAEHRDMLRSTSPDAFIVVFKGVEQIEVTIDMKK